MSANSVFAFPCPPVDAGDAWAVARAVAQQLSRPEGAPLGVDGPAWLQLGDGGVSLVAPSIAGPWRAPEWAPGAPPTRATDAYALGCLMRWLLGEPPARHHHDGLAGYLALADALTREDPLARCVQLAAVARMVRARPPRAAWPAVRPIYRWAVVGVDPGDGAPCIVDSGLTRGQARRLAARLPSWSARVVCTAVGVRGLVGAALLALGGAVLLSLIGGTLGGLAGWKLASRRVVRSLPGRLAPSRTPVPPRRLPPLNEVYVAAGVAMFATAFALVLAAKLVAAPVGLALAAPVGLAVAAAPALLFGAAIVAGSRLAPTVYAPVSEAVAETLAVAESSSLPLDVQLGLIGEAVAVERACRGGQLAVPLALERVSRVRAQLAGSVGR